MKYANGKSGNANNMEKRLELCNFVFHLSFCFVLNLILHIASR